MRNFASRCGKQYEGLPRRPPNEPLTATSESLFCRRPVMPRVLTCQTWIALDGKDQVVDNAIFPIIIPGWRRVLRGEVLLSRLGDWDVGSAGCATTPMVRMSAGDHGPSWACATRPSRSVATPKYQSARHQSAQAAFSIRLPDVITIPWFKLPSSHRPWNTSSRSSAS